MDCTPGLRFGIGALSPTTNIYKLEQPVRPRTRTRYIDSILPLQFKDIQKNPHHIVEAQFKAFARALRAAVAIDPAERGVPSTKGTLV